LEAEILRPDSVEKALLRPRFNIAPTQAHWLGRISGERRTIEPAHFGVAGIRAPIVNNARCETVAVNPLFAPAFQKRRRVVPADGFFEWTSPKGDR
jgi:putative SOS response-associated peptidase YedK